MLIFKTIDPIFRKFKNDKHQFKKARSEPITIPSITSTCKKTQSCSFCKGMDHRITNCPLKGSYGKPHYGTELIMYLSKLCHFSILPEDDKEMIFTAEVCYQSGIKHIIVHMIHLKISNFSDDSRPSDDELATTVSFLDGCGKSMSGCKRCLLNCCRLLEYIYKHQKKQGRYILHN